ncbi:CLUMA_CG002859, isoform A [Clunio marinus]|uniref:CLUMA_CG002859, isoform A n=1 Tax=Clunio marinus TaxID=568069 RepID=A0A1J1HNQ4_9DIPT|nr:CLUMA_CG002859, isoform A [Clunio marinus]
MREAAVGCLRKKKRDQYFVYIKTKLTCELKMKIYLRIKANLLRSVIAVDNDVVKISYGRLKLLERLSLIS